MKVILLSDVKGRGKEGDVIEVARGFATNYLLPRNIAVPATAGNLKQLEARMHNIHKREEAKRAEAEGQAARIGGKTLVIEAKAGDAGKLFGSVTSGMVADALMAQLGVDVDRRRLDLHGHIKVLGEHTIDVRIYQDVTVQLVLNVVPEGGAPVAATTAAAAPASVIEELAPAGEVFAADEQAADVAGLDAKIEPEISQVETTTDEIEQTEDEA